MLTKRIIPCLDIQNGRTVKGVNFLDLRDAGDPVELAVKYAQEGADELVFLDITATAEKRKTLIELVTQVAATINIPFTVGGGIGSVKDVDALLKAGADKVCVNSAALKRPNLINELAAKFGNQSIVLAVDAKKIEERWMVHQVGGAVNTGLDLFDWVEEAVKRGAGEVLFTSMDHDGTKSGFALEALKKLEKKVNVPIIASGGAGHPDHFVTLFKESNIDAALAASIFHFNEVKIPQLKQLLKTNNIPVR